MIDGLIWSLVGGFMVTGALVWFIDMEVNGKPRLPLIAYVLLWPFMVRR